jgi:hypothetical protein
VYFIDNSGDIIKTIVDWICPRGTQSFPLAVIDGLPGNWVGQVRVESQEWWTPGDPKVLPPNIVSIAELIRWDGPQQTVLLEGVAYNLFPEQQAFDWQLGSDCKDKFGRTVKGGLCSGVGLIGIPSFMNNMGGGGETGLTTELAIANLVPKPGFTDFAMYIYDQNGLLDFVCEKLNEKQVEYINVADWNYINEGFKGSAVISAVFWEHPVLEQGSLGQAKYVRNLVGLAAVKVERFNWPLVPSPDPAFDAPGDQSSASEGFPVIGAGVAGEFDFEGPQAPACPGVGEDTCEVPVRVRVTHNGLPPPLGQPVQGAVVQIRTVGGSVPLATGITDESGQVDLTVPVSGLVTRYEIWVATPDDPELRQVGRTRLLLDGPVCPQVQPGNIRVVVPVQPRFFTIRGTAFLPGPGALCDPTGRTRWEGLRIRLQDQTQVSLNTEVVMEPHVYDIVATNANGEFEFTALQSSRVDSTAVGLIASDDEYVLAALLQDVAGDPVPVTSNSFILGEDETRNFRSDLLLGPVSPIEDVWCNPDIVIPTREPTATPEPPVLDVEGSVFDCSGIPVPGQRVQIVGTNVWAVTDANGQFTFEAFEGDFTQGIYFVDVNGHRYDLDGDGTADPIEFIDADGDGDVDDADLFIKNNIRQINFIGVNCIENITPTATPVPPTATPSTPTPSATPTATPFKKRIKLIAVGAAAYCGSGDGATGNAIQLVDSSGTGIYTARVVNPTQFVFDVGDFNEGAYYVRINTGVTPTYPDGPPPFDPYVDEPPSAGPVGQYLWHLTVNGGGTRSFLWELKDTDGDSDVDWKDLSAKNSEPEFDFTGANCVQQDLLGDQE